MSAKHELPIEVRDHRDRPVFIHSELDDLGLTLEAFRVYCHLARRANHYSQAWPSYNSIGEVCFRGSYPNSPKATLKQKAIAAINELKQRRLVSTKPRTDINGAAISNIYYLLPRHDWKVNTLSQSSVNTKKGRTGLTRRKRNRSGVINSDNTLDNPPRLTQITPPVNPDNPPRLTRITPPVNPDNQEGSMEPSHTKNFKPVFEAEGNPVEVNPIEGNPYIHTTTSPWCQYSTPCVGNEKKKVALSDSSDTDNLNGSAKASEVMTAKHSINKTRLTQSGIKSNSLLSSSKQQSQRRTLETEFKLWKQEIDQPIWNKFINWKAQQAPSSVRDKLAWAYNTLKANLERAQLSFQSFQQEACLQTSDTKPDGTPNFKLWDKTQHIELACQYLVKGVAFLKEKSWHPKWVEFVQAAMPTFFDEMQEGVT